MSVIRKYSYEECKEIVDQKLEVLKAKKGMKNFCRENELSYNTLIMFKNNKLVRSVSEKFIIQVLEAFNYNVEVHATITYNIKKN